MAQTALASIYGMHQGPADEGMTSRAWLLASEVEFGVTPVWSARGLDLHDTVGAGVGWVIYLSHNYIRLIRAKSARHI